MALWNQKFDQLKLFQVSMPDRLRRHLGDNAEMHALALRAHFEKSARQDKMFFNEGKICLATDLHPGTTALDVFQGTYFHSFLTNELSTLCLEETGAYPKALYRGLEYYPATKVGDAWALRSISESSMSNHIGVSTLLYCASDRTIQLWRQTKSAQVSEGMLSATGSGSCDWTDFKTLTTKGPVTLRAMICASAERELQEESDILANALGSTTIETRLLGFFRWGRRGGKPEFLALSRADISSTDLQPNTMEVDAPGTNESLLLSASTFAELIESIDSSLRDEPSVSLYSALRCLRDRCLDDPHGVRQFFWGQPNISDV